MPNGKPNILVVWRDDIGISNLRAAMAALLDISGSFRRRGTHRPPSVSTKQPKSCNS